jgi:hypothetical protein
MLRHSPCDFGKWSAVRRADIIWQHPQSDIREGKRRENAENKVTDNGIDVPNIDNETSKETKDRNTSHFTDE